MAVVGLIPFVYAAIKRKKKRRTSVANTYDSLATGAAARGREWERAKFTSGGAYQSLSCRFALIPSPADDLGVSHGEGSPDYLSGDLFSADRHWSHPARAYHLSQSFRFAARPSQGDELGTVSYNDGAARRLPPEDLSGHLLLPARHQNNRLVTKTAWGRENPRSNGGVYQSQSCRLAVRPLLPSSNHGFSHDDDGAACTPPEHQSYRLLLPASRHDRGLSRSLRFSSMRVFGWVSGA